ncbi:lytic transglycosylase domain-containing protein [Sphingomonas lenta]|nr:lytic transglycosylase domain-containing protein [Sphingomonas lenta]
MPLIGKQLISWPAASLAALGLLALSTPAAAQTANCGAAAIDKRFAEAARFCRSPVGRQAAAVAPAATAPVPTTPSWAERPQTVSVSMPGYRRRLEKAANAVRASRAAPTDALVTAIAHRYRINPHLLQSMMRAESAGRPGAISHKGALGLMQVMPATARGLGVRDPRRMLTDPVLAVSTGAVYLKQLQRQLGNNVPLVVAAYNAGPGAVIKAGRKVPRYRETQGYVRKVMGDYSRAMAGGGPARAR